MTNRVKIRQSKSRLYTSILLTRAGGTGNSRCTSTMIRAVSSGKRRERDFLCNEPFCLSEGLMGVAMASVRASQKSRGDKLQVGIAHQEMLHGIDSRGRPVGTPQNNGEARSSQG